MDAIIKKWGNSPALRLSAAAMKEAQFSVEQRVSVKAAKGRIVIEPAELQDMRLDDLLSGITPENLHAESGFGPPEGCEIL